jgi:hypothetical protein
VVRLVLVANCQFPVFGVRVTSMASPKIMFSARELGAKS